MKLRWIALLVLVVGAVAWAGRSLPHAQVTAAESRAEEPMLAHDVYFTLQDNSPEQVAALVDACKKYLVDHPGVVYFACGTVADYDRPVNDRGFDVALKVVFADRASHDKYQTAPTHLQFIEENRANWKQVRVFDADVESIAPR